MRQALYLHTLQSHLSIPDAHISKAPLITGSSPGILSTSGGEHEQEFPLLPEPAFGGGGNGVHMRQTCQEPGVCTGGSGQADCLQEPWGRGLQRRLGDEGTSDSCFSKSGIQEESPISLGPLTESPPYTWVLRTQGHINKRALRSGQLSQMPHLPGTQRVMRYCAGSRGP